MFALADLWGGWAGNDGRIEFSSILVTGVNDTFRVVHDRMPVIVAPEGYGQWLDPAAAGGKNTPRPWRSTRSASGSITRPVTMPGVFGR